MRKENPESKLTRSNKTTHHNRARSLREATAQNQSNRISSPVMAENAERNLSGVYSILWSKQAS